MAGRPEVGNLHPTTRSGRRKSLTGIPLLYTLAATQDDAGEVERLMIINFLKVLAEVALAVASRKQGGESQ